MINKYNLAFIPKLSADRQKIIEYAQKHLSISDQYMLSENSLPHVTIHQFHANKEQVKTIICSVEISTLLKLIELSFEELSCISFDNIIFWASLMPNHRDILTSLHQSFANLLNFPSRENYDPHMTLFNSMDSTYETLVNTIKLQYQCISADFVLAIGECDDLGQFTRIIHLFN